MCHVRAVLVLPEASSLCWTNAAADMPQTRAEADVILYNITGNLTKRILSTASLLNRELSLVIRDASLQRLTLFEPDSSEACTWPMCAPYCVPCAKTHKYWLCCQVNSQCIFADCFAHPGFCYADASASWELCHPAPTLPARQNIWAGL